MTGFDMSSIHEPLKDLYLIDLDLPRTGFRRFISCWLWRPDDTTILVDPGPRAAYPALRSALQSLGIKKIDVILLTHIHIDHAGGLGLLIQDYPGTRVIAHPKSFAHLADPSRLWEESRKVLGTLADDYGSIEPVPRDLLSFSESTTVNNISVQAIDTPGHAPHHLCFLIGDLLFAGEIAGIHYPLPDTFYLRPATPLGFRLDIFRSSLEKVLTLPAARVCFAHYGYRTDSKPIWTSAMGQLNQWLEIIGAHTRETEEIFSEEMIFEELLEKDPLLSGFPLLPPDIQVRERYFMTNSIRGMRRYLMNLESPLS
ncbi:MAG: MBL fold metallo-hydrolase [Syntrophales bacterium]|nr:MBL fold metallo-hydrolase [Syntrophales bacterium]